MTVEVAVKGLGVSRALEGFNPSGFAMTAVAPIRGWMASLRGLKGRSHLHRWGLSLIGALALATTVAQAQTPVDIPSLDAPQGQIIQQPSFWFPSPHVAPGSTAPAMLLLHGCAGIYTSRENRLVQRMREYSALLNRMGIHVLVTDSLTPRGEKELCTQPEAGRKVTQTQRRRDALGALQWLSQQPGVDGARLGIMGWSNGGSTVLAATNALHKEVAAAPVKPSLAVLYYPGCLADLRRGYKPVAPALMQVGEADDWTPAEHCKKLAAQFNDPASGPPILIEAYEGAHHGFDGPGPVVHRKDVPNGKYPGSGVHVGGHPAARATSFERLEAFLRSQWRLSP